MAASSAPGPDGLPYAAWAAAGASSGETFEQVSDVLLQWYWPPREILQSVGIFIPKGDSEQDCVEIVRAPGDTRSIGFKNTDNKVICSSRKYKLRRLTTERTCAVQRVFAPGRLLTQNAIDLDAAASFFFGCGVHRSVKALLAFWDFKSAFPSLAHEWIRITVSAPGLPRGFLNFLAAIYDGSEAVSSGSKGLIFLYGVLTGVLQGCP